MRPAIRTRRPASTPPSSAIGTRATATTYARRCRIAALAALAAAAFTASAIEPAAADAACRKADGKPAKISKRQAERAVRCLVNARREARGLKRLKPRGRLGTAAFRHSRKMRRSGCFAHRCGGERSLTGRVKRTGYLPCGCRYRLGETIAWGKRSLGTPRAIVRAWMGSYSHRTILLDARLRHLGVGAIKGRPGARAAHSRTYTADFGFKSG